MLINMAAKQEVVLISYQAATGYLSSCKTFFEKKFAYGPIDKMSVFRTSCWRSLRSKLLANFHENAQPTGESLFDPHIASNETDRIALARACVWRGDRKFAEYLHLNNTMMQFSGRGSEVSLHCCQHIGVVSRAEHGCKYRVLQSFVKRQKNGQEQKLPIYPSASTWEQNWYFSLLYRIFLVGFDSEHIFPEFAEKALHSRDNLSDSKVSALWSDYFKDIYQYLVEIEGLVVVQLNQKLSSHHAKKGSNEEMAQSSSCSGLAQIFRTGWEVATGSGCIFRIPRKDLHAHLRNLFLNEWVHRWNHIGGRRDVSGCRVRSRVTPIPEGVVVIRMVETRAGVEYRGGSDGLKLNIPGRARACNCYRGVEPCHSAGTNDLSVRESVT